MIMNDTLNNQSISIDLSKIYLYQSIIKVLLGCLLFGLSLLTIFGNLLVFYAIRTEKRLRTVSNLFILSLAFADLIVGFIVMPLSAAYIISGYWPFSTFFCQMWLSIDYVASTASIFNLILLSFDRYRAVVHPLHYLQSRSRKCAIYCLIFIWFVSSLWSPAIIFWSYFHPETSDQLQPTECDTSFRSNKLFKTLTALVNFYLPLLTMILISCRIMIAIRSRSTMEFGQRIPSTVHKYRQRNQTLTNISIHEIAQKVKQTRPLSSSELETTANISIRINPFETLRKTSTQLETENCSPYSSRKQTDYRYSPLKPIEIFLPSIKTNQLSKQQSEILRRSFSTEIIMKDSSSVGDNMKYYEQDSSSSLSDEPLNSTSSPKTTLPIPSIITPSHQTSDASLHNLDQSNRIHILTFFDYIINPSLSYSLKKELKAARQLGILVGVFTITWLPYFILFVVVAWCQHCISDRIYIIVIWLGYINSTLNPFIYPLCNKHFRHAFRKVFFCKHAKIKLTNLNELHELHRLHSIRYRR